MPFGVRFVIVLPQPYSVVRYLGKRCCMRHNNLITSSVLHICASIQQTGQGVGTENAGVSSGGRVKDCKRIMTLTSEVKSFGSHYQGMLPFPEA
jgi:hypothetical protein